MGILLANIPAFAFPSSAYFSPLSWGGTGPAEIAAWLVNFVFVEGRMRGLFSFLFGASMLLILDRARGSGQGGAQVHYSRMAVLFLFGTAHNYLIWWGDILAHYALVGAIAFLFARMRASQLMAAAVTTLVLAFLWACGGQFAIMESAARDTPDAVTAWNGFAEVFGVPPRDVIDKEIAAMLGPWTGEVAYRWANSGGVLAFLKEVGVETLAAMLFGMWAYRSGFITGSWDRARYRRIAIFGVGIASIAYLLIGLNTIAQGFDQRWIYFGSILATVPFRIIGTIGYAALVILALKPGGWLTERLAAVGRAAFTNYLGTSILVTAIFYGWGLGQFAKWDRATIYVVPPLIWLAMLLWSKPWLDRYRYGPLEWLWRSLSRLELQPMRNSSSLSA